MKKPAKSTLVLFDAHAIIHRAYHALPELTSSKGEPTGGLYGVSTMLMKIIKELKPDYLVACYDLPGPTFRKQIYDEYKAGRAKTDDALKTQLQRSRDIFTAFGIPIYDKPGFEADDIIGTIVEETAKDKNLLVIIASGDMDTMQLIDDDRVLVYTLKKGLNDTILYDEAKVVERFGFKPALLTDYKGLRGDPSDNIIGIAGIGEKTATDLIVNFGALEKMFQVLKKSPDKFLDVGIKARMIELLKNGEEEALFSKTLATIRRDAPIDFKLPEKKWGETVDINKITELFTELEFRTLVNRAKEMLSSHNGKSEELTEKIEAKAEIKVDPLELRKAQIGLWLINSELLNPTLEDILTFGKTEDFNVVKEKINKELVEKKLTKVYEEIELPLIPIIDEAERWGILVDVKYLEKLSKEYHAELSKLEHDIWRLAGREFNIGSPKQLGEVLFDEMKLTVKGLKKTAGGARSTRESELEKLKEVHPIIAKILDYREFAKLLNTYIDAIPKLVDQNNRLHSHLNQTGAATGRMSSQNPNLQNIPAREGVGERVRTAFVATPGHKWIACDYSQIELRVLALLSGDEELERIFKAGEDVHTSVAARVFGVDPDKVTKDMRRQAKVINFGIIYGMGVNALRTNLGSTREEAQKFYDNYFATFPKIRAYFENVIADATRLGYTETFFGRRRYFPGLKSKIPFMRAMGERMAMNAPLQGTAADIVKIAMVEINEQLKKKGLADKIHFILQVHDELIYEVEDSVVKEAELLIKTVMEAAIETRIPFAANVAVGDNWGELK